MVALLGPRQTGKSTLAREIASSWKRGRATVFDLEREGDLRRLAEPSAALEPLRGLVVIDEVHRRPDLFSTLRVLADRPNRPARFLVLGIASPHLLEQSSETLAGRIAFHELPGLSLDEVGPHSAAPGVTASMRTALVDLELDSLDVIHAGRETYPLTDRIRAVALTRLHEDVGGASKARRRRG